MILNNPTNTSVADLKPEQNRLSHLIAQWQE